MSVAGHQVPPFFKRGPAPLARLIFFVALSLALLVADLRFRYLEGIRQVIGAIVYPLQQTASAPLDLMQGAAAYFASLTSVQAENALLKRKQLEVANSLLRQQQLDLENQRLRELLDMQQRQDIPAVVADILYSVRDPFSRKVIIDRGMQHGIAAGQAVVDDAGVIGQVTRVFPLQSEVTLLTDKDQAIPVQVARNGMRAIAFGLGDGQIELRFLATNADIVEGDTLTTSGLDGIYLPGLPVAKVVRVERDASHNFARVICAPIGGVEKHNLALVLGTRVAPPPLPVEAESVEKPLKTKKGKAQRNKGADNAAHP